MAKEQITAYKVVLRDPFGRLLSISAMWGATACGVPRDLTRLDDTAYRVYHPGRWAYRHPKAGWLAVFSSLIGARMFMHNDQSVGYNHWQLWECETKQLFKPNPRSKKALWMANGKGWFPVSDLPNATALCLAVKLTRQLPKELTL